MKVITVSILAVVIALSVSSSTCALIRFYDESDKVWQQDAWPDGFADLLNAQNRVYGYCGLPLERLYYVCDTAAFNTFLADLQDLGHVDATLTLHPGRGMVNPRFDEKEPAKEFDWMVTLTGGATDQSCAEKNVIVEIDIWLGGNIDLDDLNVPAEFRVRSGDEIKKFIAEHAKKTVCKPGIYLLKEDLEGKVSGEASSPDCVIQDEPFWSMDDFKFYNWADHSFEVTAQAAARLPEVGVHGETFVMVAGGRPIYEGAFCTVFSSLYDPRPVILIDQGRKTGAFRLEYPREIGEEEVSDPRPDPAIKAAFESAGKLRTEATEASAPLPSVN